MLEYKTAPKIQKLYTRQSSIKEFTVFNKDRTTLQNIFDLF